MKIGIIGIGGIGGYIAAKLMLAADSTHIHLTCVQRGEHGAAIAKNGLHFIAKTEHIVHPHAIYANVSEAEKCDVLFFCTKSKDLEASALASQNMITPSTILVTILNGVNNAERLERVYPHNPILNGCIFVSAAITSTGVVSQKGGAGKIFLGNTEANYNAEVLELVRIMNESDLKVVLSNTILTDTWKKYLFICPFATITSVYNKTMGEIVRSELYVNKFKQLLSELYAIGIASGADLCEADKDDVINRALVIPIDTPTSMQIDVYSKKQPELEVFTGYVVSKAQELSIEVPLHKQLLSKLQTIIQEQHG